jgi:hypothetical protein
MGPYVVTDASMPRITTIAEGPKERHIVVHIDQLRKVEGELQRKSNLIRDQDLSATSEPILASEFLDNDLVVSPENSDEEVDVIETITLAVDHVIQCL